MELVKATGVTDTKYVTKEMVKNIEETQVESIMENFPAFKSKYGDRVYKTL